MSVVTALGSFDTMDAPRDEYSKYRSSVMVTSPSLSSPRLSSAALQSLSISPPATPRSSARRKSTKLSPYRLRSGSGYSLFSNDDSPRDHHQDMPAAQVPVHGLHGQSMGSVDSFSASYHSSVPSLVGDEPVQMPIFNILGPEALEIALKDPETTNRLLRFAEDKGCGQNIEFLIKVRNYTDSLKQYAAQLATISNTYTSVTATSPLNLPEQLSRPLNTNVRHVSNSLVPGLESLFDDSQAFIEKRVAADLFPAFVKHQLATCMGVSLAFGPDDGQAPLFPGLKESFCISNPSASGNPVESASDGFEELFGYSRHEILGRNCQFPQGPQTDIDTILRIQESMHRKEGFTELILNYRRNNQPFWNLLHIRPLLDPAGRVRQYLGAQIDVSASIQNDGDLLRMLRYDANEDVKKRNQAELKDAEDVLKLPSDLDDLDIRDGPCPKASRKSLFRSFKKSGTWQPSNPLKVPSRPETPVQAVKTYSTRTVLRTLMSSRNILPTPYSRFIVLEHVPSYHSSLSASALGKDPSMRTGIPPKLNILFFSEAVIESLGLGMAADAILHRDIFDVLAEQANCASVTKDFKSNVRNTVLIDGRSASLELVLLKAVAASRRPGIPRLGSGTDERDLGRRDTRSGGGTRLERMMSYWTPLKDADDEIQYVMLVLSRASIKE